MEIRILRLLSGEEIIAGLVEEKENEYLLHKPCVIRLMPTSNTTEDTAEVGLAPFPIFINRDETEVVAINKMSVITIYQPVSEIYNKYNEKFGSGIVIPAGNNIAVPKVVLTENNK